MTQSKRPGKRSDSQKNRLQRLREACRWLDELAVRTTIGRVCERIPGVPLPSLAERLRRHEQAHHDLERTDPQFYKFVRAVMRRRSKALEGITLEQWKRGALRRVARISRLRAEMRRNGSI